MQGSLSVGLCQLFPLIPCWKDCWGGERILGRVCPLTAGPQQTSCLPSQGEKGGHMISPLPLFLVVPFQSLPHRRTPVRQGPTAVPHLIGHDAYTTEAGRSAACALLAMLATDTTAQVNWRGWRWWIVYLYDTALLYLLSHASGPTVYSSWKLLFGVFTGSGFSTSPSACKEFFGWRFQGSSTES